jgi:hypothetical protein
VEPTAIVDVHAVRFVADDVHFGAEFAQRRRRDPAGGTIGAIQHHPQSGEQRVETARCLQNSM